MNTLPDHQACLEYHSLTTGSRSSRISDAIALTFVLSDISIFDEYTRILTYSYFSIHVLELLLISHLFNFSCYPML